MSSSKLGLAVGVLNLTIYTYASCSIAGDMLSSDKAENASFGLMLTTLVLSLTIVATSVLLLVGIYKKRHNLMAPYVYLMVIVIILAIIGIFTTGFKAAFKTIAGAVIALVLWYPIFTLYRQMRSESKSGLSPEHC